jgi:hypothetical protein
MSTDMASTPSTPGFMELRFALATPKPQFTPRQLLDAAQKSNIDTFGWPIGIVLQPDPYRPRPTVDGIIAEVSVPDQSYDLWAMRGNGDYYLLKSLFEDHRVPDSVFFDTRIVRVTEALLFCARLYSNLDVEPTREVHVAVRHGGLIGRHLRSAKPRIMSLDRTTIEQEIESTQVMLLGDIETKLVLLVKGFLAPLFQVFDYFEVGDPTYEQIVNDFVAGRV